MSSLMMFKITSDGEKPHIITQPQGETISHTKDLGAIVGTLQADNRSTKMKEVVEKLARLSDLFCASRKWKCNVSSKSKLVERFVVHIKCSGTFQDTNIGMLTA